MDFEVVKTEAQEFDRWVTGLVDLIPTQVYVSFLKKHLWFSFLFRYQKICYQQKLKMRKIYQKVKNEKGALIRNNVLQLPRYK